MYIKDSSFYELVRGTTEASVYFLRPVYAQLKIGETYFMSGKFEFNDSVWYTSRDGDLEFNVYCDTNSSLEPADIKEFAEGSRQLYIVVVSAVYSGVLFANPGTDRVKLYPVSMGEDGIVEVSDTFLLNENISVIESIHLAEVIHVDPSDISTLAIKEKNDIILSSIPYNDLELELFDPEGQYNEFILRHQKKLRTLVFFNYNEVHSETFLYFYGEDPTRDVTTALEKTSMKLLGLMGILSTEIYRGDSDANDDATTYWLNAISVIGSIGIDFNHRHLPIAGDGYGDYSVFGGEPLELLFSLPNHKRRRINSYNGFYYEQANNSVNSPGDGYSIADALRLISNACCMGMRIEKERIFSADVSGLIKESGAVFSEREYFKKPIPQKYNKIDKIITSTEQWAFGEAEELPQFEFDGMPDDSYWDGTRQVNVKWLDLGKPCKDISIVLPSELQGLVDVYYESSSVQLRWDASINISGYISFLPTGKPYKKTDTIDYAKRYGAGKEILEINNPLLPPRESGFSLDAPDWYMDFNYEHQSEKTIYSLETRGRFDVHPMDQVLYADENGALRSGIVIEHNLTFDGSMNSFYRILDEGDAPALVCGESVLCSETLICRGSQENDDIDDSVLSGYVPMYIGAPVQELSNYIIGQYPFSATMDRYVLTVCDASGDNVEMLNFTECSTEFSSEETVLIAKTTIGEITYHLGLNEVNVDGNGTIINSFCIKTADGVDEKLYFNALYAKNAETGFAIY